MSKNRTETRKIELVETGNIAMAIQRIWDRHANDDVVQRALMHAIEMTNTFSLERREKIRAMMQNRTP